MITHTVAKMSTHVAWSSRTGGIVMSGKPLIKGYGRFRLGAAGQALLTSRVCIRHLQSKASRSVHPDSRNCRNGGVRAAAAFRESGWFLNNRRPLDSDSVRGRLGTARHSVHPPRHGTATGSRTVAILSLIAIADLFTCMSIREVPPSALHARIPPKRWSLRWANAQIAST